MSSSSCPVCLSAYNQTTHRSIACANCPHTACRSCIQKYILERMQMGDSKLQCMSCHHVKSVDWLYSITLKSWIESKYAEAKKNLIWKMEQQTLIKDAQPFLKQAKVVEEMRVQILAMEEDIEKLLAQKEDLMDRKHALTLAVNVGDISQNLFVKPNDILGRCDQTPGCLGLLESRLVAHEISAKCTLCEIEVCVQCFKRKADQHACLEEDVSTASALCTDTRMCPSCFVRIYKTAGCDDMFCVKCGKGFNWETLTRFEGDQVHNPEREMYRDELIEGRRIEPDDTQLPCLGDLTSSELLDWDQMKRDWTMVYLSHCVFPHALPNPDLSFLQGHHKIYDIVERQLQSEMSIVDNYVRNTKRMRMRFALEHGERIDDRGGQGQEHNSVSKFKSNLWNLERKYNVAQPLDNIWNLYLNQLRRILIYVYRESEEFKSYYPSDVKKWISSQSIQSKLRELNELDTMANEALLHYAETYQTVQWRIDVTNYKLIRNTLVQSKKSNSGSVSTRKRNRSVTN